MNSRFDLAFDSFILLRVDLIAKGNITAFKSREMQTACILAVIISIRMYFNASPVAMYKATRYICYYFH